MKDNNNNNNNKESKKNAPVSFLHCQCAHTIALVPCLPPA